MNASWNIYNVSLTTSLKDFKNVCKFDYPLKSPDSTSMHMSPYIAQIIAYLFYQDFTACLSTAAISNYNSFSQIIKLHFRPHIFCCNSAKSLKKIHYKLHPNFMQLISSKFPFRLFSHFIYDKLKCDIDYDKWNRNNSSIQNSKWYP